MTKVILTGFTFKPVQKKKKITTSNHNNRVSKKIHCICIEKSPNEFVAHIDMKNDPEFSDILEIPFSEKSYNLKGKEKVFTVNKDKNGKSVMIVRNQQLATIFPGIPIQYTPFKHNYVYSGYIIKIKGNYYFDVTDIHSHKSYFNIVSCNTNIKPLILKR